MYPFLSQFTRRLGSNTSWPRGSVLLQLLKSALFKIVIVLLLDDGRHDGLVQLTGLVQLELLLGILELILILWQNWQLSNSITLEGSSTWNNVVILSWLTSSSSSSISESSVVQAVTPTSSLIMNFILYLSANTCWLKHCMLYYETCGFQNSIFYDQLSDEHIIVIEDSN